MGWDRGLEHLTFSSVYGAISLTQSVYKAIPQLNKKKRQSKGQAQATFATGLTDLRLNQPNLITATIPRARRGQTLRLLQYIIKIGEF